MRSFASKLRTRLAELKMSQAELARQTGMGEAQISRYLHNKNVPDRRYSQERLAAALGVGLEWFK